MMKKLLLAVAFLAPALAVSAQVLHPLSWKVSAEQLEPEVYELHAVGTFAAPGWHIYDLSENGATGPSATVFKVGGVPVLEGPRIVSEVQRVMDPAFGREIGICPGPVEIVQKVSVPGGESAEAVVTIEWQCCNDGSCIAPEEGEYKVRVGAVVKEASAKPAGSSGRSLWALILEAIAWGFVALLTPCVFPMVPMTVRFFLKHNDKAGGRRRGRWLASVFGLSIVALYTLPIAVIILVTYLTGGAAVTADIFNWLATHWLPNILFFIIFMVFAASFFGAFEITLPSSLVNKSDAKSDKGGLVGVFFVALTLVLVSFSCTGPIVGSVLIKSTQGQFWEPIVTMLAFSVAFALPFTVLAFVPSLLKKLPKSGGWLNSVKVVLGFIEVALGFKFLSVADQTYHWGLLDREVYLAIWIVVFTLLGLYLLGKIRFANDSPVQHLTVFRLVLVIAVFSFVVYMVPGMWGAPLKALSGYLPPITTQDFNLDRPAPTAYAAGAPQQSGERKYADFLELPYGIEAWFDYGQAREAALASGKPILVDFTGHGCVNCREMEARVWSDPRVMKMMKEDYVVCALFADDKKILPAEDWVTTPDGKVLKSLGKVNSWFAMTRFNVNAQPYYAILDPVTEAHKVPSRGYNLDVEAFVEFLREGLK